MAYNPVIEEWIRRKRAEHQARIDQKFQEEAVAKSIIHVGVAVSTDGPFPGKDNIIGVSACIGENYLFDQNVTPTDGMYHNSAFWSKHPEEFEALKIASKPLPEAMQMFAKWLDQWQGRLVACCSILDFWHLFPAMMEHTGGCAFGTLPMDAASYYCGANHTKAPGKITDHVKPLEVAKERWKMVSEGAMPVFGKSKQKAYRKEPADPYTAFLRHREAPTRARRPVDIWAAAPPPPELGQVQGHIYNLQQEAVQGAANNLRFGWGEEADRVVRHGDNIIVNPPQRNNH